MQALTDEGGYSNNLEDSFDGLLTSLSGIKETRLLTRLRMTAILFDSL